MSSSPHSQSSSLDLPAALLWASALILFGLVVVQASRLGVGTEAHAGDSASSVGDLSALTVSDGDQQDVLLVLDGREQELLVYTLQGSQRINTPTVIDLNDAFNNARGTPDRGQSRQGR